MRVGDRKAELVLGSRVGEIDQFQSAVGIEIDEVAIRRRIRGAREDADAPVDVATDTQKLLLEYGVDAVVAWSEPPTGMTEYQHGYEQGHAIAGGK
jgi:hypothetical protein